MCRWNVRIILLDCSFYEDNGLAKSSAGRFRSILV